MTSQFNPNTLAFGDDAGLGIWLVGHYRQHLAYNAFLASLASPIIIPTYNILAIAGGRLGMRGWLDDHEKWHEQIRPFANVTGVDFSAVDFNNESEFYAWIDLHNQEHAIIDTAFGLG